MLALKKLSKLFYTSMTVSPILTVKFRFTTQMSRGRIICELDSRVLVLDMMLYICL